MEGSDIEADKAVVEGLYEPLLHMIRNAVDHGIEAPQARERRWQAAARQDSDRAPGSSAIASSSRSTDDGAGVDVDRVRAVAMSRGLVTPEQAARAR